MGFIASNDMRWAVHVVDENDDVQTEFFRDRDSAEDFADECAAEGRDCFLSQLVHTLRARPREMPDPLDPCAYGVAPGVDYPATLFPPAGKTAA